MSLLSGIAWLLLEYIPWLSGYIFTVIIATLAALIGQTWSALAALFLLVGVSMVGRHWRYLLAAVALASWLAMHLLNYVSRIANWPIEMFKVCWIALFFLVLAAPFFRRWRELAISCLTLFVTLHAFLLTSLVPEPVVLPNRWLQDAGFRIYAAHMIQSMSPKVFLSKCKLVDYLEENGTRQQVGGCYDGLRSTVWFRLLVIYDPSGQFARPANQRTLAWRLAALHLPDGRSFAHDDDVRHLVGSFYWFLDSSPDPGDNG